MRRKLCCAVVEDAQAEIMCNGKKGKSGGGRGSCELTSLLVELVIERLEGKAVW